MRGGHSAEMTCPSCRAGTPVGGHCRSCYARLPVALDRLVSCSRCNYLVPREAEWCPGCLSSEFARRPRPCHPLRSRPRSFGRLHENRSREGGAPSRTGRRNVGPWDLRPLPPCSGSYSRAGSARGMQPCLVCVFTVTRRSVSAFRLSSNTRSVHPERRLSRPLSGESVAGYHNVGNSSRAGLCSTLVRQRTTETGASIPSQVVNTRTLAREDCAPERLLSGKSAYYTHSIHNTRLVNQ